MDTAGLSIAQDELPAHVAVVMDGNGRWAQKQGYSRLEGHRRGVDNVRSMVENCIQLGILIFDVVRFQQRKLASAEAGSRMADAFAGPGSGTGSPGTSLQWRSVAIYRGIFQLWRQGYKTRSIRPVTSLATMPPCT